MADRGETSFASIKRNRGMQIAAYRGDRVEESASTFRTPSSPDVFGFAIISRIYRRSIVDTRLVETTRRNKVFRS